MDAYEEARAYRAKNPEVGLLGFLQELLEMGPTSHPGYKGGETPLNRQERHDLVVAHVVLDQTETYVVPRQPDYLCDPTPMYGFDPGDDDRFTTALGRVRDHSETERWLQSGIDDGETIDPWPVYACIRVPRPEGATTPTHEGES